MYKHSLSEKLVIMVVINGWPATAARVLRSFLMCSTCFKRMTIATPIRPSHLCTNSSHIVIVLTVGLSEYFQGEDFLVALFFGGA